MEGLLFVLLIAWLLGKGKKKGKKRRNRTAEAFRQMQQAVQTPAQKAPEQPQEPEAVPAFQPLAEGQSHMAFTEDAHGCVSEREEYMGSMHADTSEGEDACDPALEHERAPAFEPESVYAGEIGGEPLLDLSAKGIYQGVVMSEILTMPARRGVRRF